MEFKAINIKELARLMAHGNDHDQCEFINELACELKVGCRDENLDGMQICYIASGLNKNGKDLIKSMKAFIDIREKEEPKE